MPIVLPQLSAAYEAARRLRESDRGAVDLVGPWGSAKGVIAHQAAAELDAPLLVLTAHPAEADAIFDDLSTFAGEERAALFPAWEVLPGDAMAPADDIVAERLNTLRRLNSALDGGEPLRVVMPLRAFLQKVIARDRLAADTLTVRIGQEHDMEDLIQRLAKMGYERDLMVESRGQMSVRGGIFDVFPINAELPIRIEFFGDEVESIRCFEPETQRSADRLKEAQFLPRSERSVLAEGEERPGTLGAVLDYFPDNTLIVLDEPTAIREQARQLEEEYGELPYFLSWNGIQRRLAQRRSIAMAQVAFQREDGEAPRVVAPMGSMTGWERHLESFWQQLEQWDRQQYSVYLVCNNTGERNRLLELLRERGYRPGADGFDLHVDIGRLREGFHSAEDQVAVLSEREMFGRHHLRRKRRRFEAGTSVTSFSDLHAGDYVVHGRHGIGRYLGLRRFEGKSGDFLAVQYAGGDTIYVPVTHIDQIQKYNAGEGATPKVDKLGGSTWSRTKSRVKKAVRDMTRELVDLYARREAHTGHAFSADTHWQNEFEDSFEYDETPDQLRAIQEVKRDMESPKPMDRLLCGDVGFGKTEVALRAAFKAVMDGKQAAVLVPTTVLAEQHYLTFCERMADYPVTIEMLSRFRTNKQIKQTIDRLKSGEVDIAVGTHRLVSKDVAFKDLGLVIIDEEQRFGVAQKERLKQLRATVDVLTMTATPIPRTLNLALLGARDMSVINTAPNDRLPIHTCIENFDERLVQEALRRELARDGQVFFVHNRVQSIEPFAELVQRLTPTARVAIGHGQMPEGKLEEIMTAFVRGEIDVLVCTTIIGSGIDIPNANTIIINNADHFGLAELYQLRGRVGRYKHRAFAYLLVPGDRVTSEDAQKRLKALEEFSTLGSGFRIAMRDLEIRGAGNILGGEQHGQILAVGYETYTQLIQETIAEQKGEPVRRRELPPFEIAVDAFIPGDYIPSEAQKITLYKRAAAVRSVDEVDELLQELDDRFGTPPAPVKRLLNVMRVRALAAEAGAQRVVASKDQIEVEFDTGGHLTRQTRSHLSQEFGGRLDFAWADTPRALFALNGEDPLAIGQQLLQAFAEA